MVSGVSDISSSEGNLRRLSIICFYISSGERRLNSLFEKMRDQVGLSNRNVFMRHVSLLNKLKLVDSFQNYLQLTGYGKALVSLDGKLDNAPLNFYEKIVWFKVFFASRTANQLVSILDSIRTSETASKHDIIRIFFSGTEAKKIWNHTIIQMNLARLEHEKKSSFFENKFGCMISWIRQLDLVEINKSIYSLTKGCLDAYPILSDPKTRESRITESAALSQVVKARAFRWETDQPFLLDLIKESSVLFRGQTGLIDAQAMASYIGARFLSKSVILEDQGFYLLLNRLVGEEIVDRVLLGREGKPAQIAMSWRAGNPTSL